MALKCNSGFPFYPKFYFLGIKDYCDSSSHTWLNWENTWDCILVTECRACSSQLTEQSRGGMNNPFSGSFCQNLQPVVYCVGTNNKMPKRNLKSERRSDIERQNSDSLRVLRLLAPVACHLSTGRFFLLSFTFRGFGSRLTFLSAHALCFAV